MKFRGWPPTIIILLAMLPALARGQAASFVGASAATPSAASVNAITLTAPAAIVAGNFLVAYVAQNYSYLSVSSTPSGWSTYQDTSSSTIGMAVYYKVATAADIAGVSTYTWTFGESGITQGAILAFSGLTTGYQIAAANIQTNPASTNRTAPSVTPGTPDTLIVTVFAAANGTADSPSTPTGLAPALNSGTGGGASGVLLSAFYGLVSASSATGPYVSTSGSGVSTTSIGSTLALIPIVGTPMAQWHFDEATWTGAAGQVLDSSGNGYHATAEHAAATADTTPAIAGSAAGTCGYGTFNGSTQTVQMPSSLPHVGNTFTVTAWIYPSSYGNGRVWIDDENYDGYAMSYGDGGTGLMRFFIRSPSLTTLDAYQAITPNQWYFVAIVLDAVSAKTMSLYIFNASGQLINLNSTSRTTYTASTGANAEVGGNADAAVEGPVIRFPGSIDEVTVYPIALSYNNVVAAQSLTHPCGGASAIPNHYAVSTPGTAVNCQAAAVTIAAHTSTHATLATADTIALGTSTGHGDWTLTRGAGTFTPGAANSGAAGYKFAAADAGTAVFALRDTYAETVTINVADGAVTATSGTALASEDSPLTFVPSGFIFTNGNNVPTAIGTQLAGVASTQGLALQAVRTDTRTNTCTAAFTSGTTVSVGLAYQCNNPTTCVSGQSLVITNNGISTSIASNPAAALASYTSVPVKFSTANAEAPISVNYSDSGQITLAAKYNIPLGNGAASANVMSGAGQFVVQPYTLTLSNIRRTSTGLPNPGAQSPTGSVFLGAGQAFSATVSALNLLGSATPNFGQEISPAGFALTPLLLLPSGGDDPAVSGSFGSFSAGTATGASFSWPEVGIISLTPTVTNYLGSGAITGTASGAVGRFVPDHFATALNTPLFATACTAGGFTYVGQPFSYSVAPVITVTAQSLGGATTSNYAGSLFRLSNAALTNRSYSSTPSSAALTLTGLPATTSDPAISSTGAGMATLTFSAGSGLAFTRGSAIAPFNANIALSIDVFDLDGVAATGNPVTFGSSSGIAFTTGPAQRYGRIALQTALGSELLDLPMSLATQYYAGPAQGFTVNTQDVCTAAPALAFSNYQLNLTAGKTCVRDSGNPGVSGVGCATAAASAYSPLTNSGAFTLILAAPGGGNAGSVDVSASAPAWLQYLWNTSAGVNTGPTSLATFGVFPGAASRIYQREVY